MKVDAIDFPLHLIKTYIIKAFEARTSYGAHAMIWDEKMFFPSHEDVFALGDVLNYDCRALSCLL